MNNKLFLLKYGEIALKGLNRPMFENKLLDNIKSSIENLGKFSVKKSQSTIYVIPLEDVDMKEAMSRLKKVFGIASVCLAEKTEKEMDKICSTAVECIKEAITTEKTFKVETVREDKNFPMNSPQINAKLGEYILHAMPELSVNVRNYDMLVNVDIRSDAYIYTKKERGAGGMPVGTNGKAALLLSGGIDSPVAGYMIAKRGVNLDAVHFYSYPYTSERAKEKVIELAKVLSDYAGKINLHIVPFTGIQLEINKNCPGNLSTLIMRRMMMQISEKIAVKNGAQALITGESIGQVASQTMESLVVTDTSVNLPVFRPVIGMDKEEIVSIAKKIDTYETSILPYEDCCTVFVPKHPVTKPKIDNILNAEEILNTEELFNIALANTEIITLK